MQGGGKQNQAPTDLLAFQLVSEQEVPPCLQSWALGLPGSVLSALAGSGSLGFLPGELEGRECCDLCPLLDPPAVHCLVIAARPVLMLFNALAQCLSNPELCGFRGTCRFAELTAFTRLNAGS